jgi:diacylglycerol O-acyltransferase
MNGAEALMWALDADPALRSSFLSLTILDSPPDPSRLRERMRAAVEANPVMSQRVVGSAFDINPPRWERDPAFDIDYHVRRVALPPPGNRRELLDLAALLYADPMDRTRPLWQFTVVEGLQDGGAALFAKMHHVISDGIGAVRLSASFLDLSPSGDPLLSGPPVAAPAPSRNWFDAAAGAVSPLIGLARNPVGGVSAGISTVRSLGRQLGLTDPARSPLWTAPRSYTHRFETTSLDLSRVRAVAKKLGGTVNDAFVTVMADAAGAYHRAHGQDVDELRMAMPISVRHDKAAGGNAWVPSRLLVPVGAMAAEDRFSLIHERLSAVRHEPSLGLTETFAGLARHIPTPVLVRFAHQQTGTVDFACSNVRGAPFDLWISGARVIANYPMGPTAGAAFNATVLSYNDALDLGLNSDTGAIEDTGLLRACIDESASVLLSTV